MDVFGCQFVYFFSLVVCCLFLHVSLVVIVMEFVFNVVVIAVYYDDLSSVVVLGFFKIQFSFVWHLLFF